MGSCLVTAKVTTSPRVAGLFSFGPLSSNKMHWVIFLLAEIFLPGQVEATPLRLLTQRGNGVSESGYNHQFNTVLPFRAILPPWSSYPPPVPLWAIRKPRREFWPYFGLHSPPGQGRPQQLVPFQSNCQPESSTGNLPINCISIVEALRDNDVKTEELRRFVGI